MQAMIVTPAPGPKPFTPKSNIENQSGAESTFAPTLDQAINNKKSSADPTKETARSTQAAKVNKSSKDESNSEAESETAATQAPVTHQAASTNDQSATVHANASKTASTDQEKTSTLNSTGSRLADSQIDSEISALEQQSSSKTKANENEKLLSKNVQGQRTSDAFTQHSSKSNKESVVSAHFNQTLDSSSAISKDRMTSEHKQQPGNVVYVQNNDSISWKEPKSSTPNLLSQNTTLQQFNIDNSESSNNSAIRIERFTAHAELAAANANIESDKSLPLSAERIAAKLTDIPLHANHATSLRDNQLSLRHESHTEFLDAKIDHIEKMQLGQADQQSLNPDSDSTQKDSLASTPKNIDKPSDVSFTHSMHNASSEKSTGSVIDALRPGGSAFTNQIHENNILNQVLNKFRISQHMQDSRVVMKLHPAELGELKIDVHLKDGAINANILAQSQQVQDILEKNMPRLKALMEEQGLIVSEIAIKLDTDVTDNKNMFEGHLSQDEQSSAPQKNVASSITFELEQEPMEDVEFLEQAAPSGVNVMI